MWLAGFALLIIPLFAEEPQPPAVPQDFPEIRFSMNPIYHSTGVKLGHVLTVRRERPVLSTYEGEMMLGFGTAPETVVDRQCMQNIRSQNREECELFVNPWRFSLLNTATFNLLSIIKDKALVIYYINYFIAPSHLLMKTRNQVLNVFATQADLQIEPRFRIRAWSRIHPSAGVITGRIVQASLEYPFRKTYEVIIQESENANNFRAMSVNDGDLFNYIMRAMLTGRQLRIEYIRLYRPHASVLTSLFNYMTNMRVISVELLGAPPQPAQ